MSNFTYEELAEEFLKAIEGIEPQIERPPGAFTTEELAMQLGRSRTWAIKRIKTLLRARKAETVRFQIKNMIGTTVNTTGYRLINETPNRGTEA